MRSLTFKKISLHPLTFYVLYCQSIWGLSLHLIIKYCGWLNFVHLFELCYIQFNSFTFCRLLWQKNFFISRNDKSYRWPTDCSVSSKYIHSFGGHFRCSLWKPVVLQYGYELYQLDCFRIVQIKILSIFFHSLWNRTVCKCGFLLLLERLENGDNIFLHYTRSSRYCFNNRIYRLNPNQPPEISYFKTYKELTSSNW